MVAKASLGKKSFIIALAFMMLLQVLLTAKAAAYNSSILPPSNLAAQQVTPDDIRLTWSPVNGATGYKLYRITDGQLLPSGTASTTSYNLNDLAEGSYTYVVATLSAAGESGPGEPVSFDIVYPEMSAPATVSHTIQNGNDVILNWTASQYAERYNVYQITVDGQQTLQSTSTSPSYAIRNVAAGTYTYAISASNSMYGESPLSSALSINVVYPTMAAPANLAYTVTNGSDLNLRWNAVSYATSYNVYQMIDGQRVYVSTVTGTSTTYRNVPAGEHTYIVHANSDRFGESAEGSTIAVAISEITMAPPSNLTIKVLNSNDIVMTWTSVPYAKSYNIYQIVDGQAVLKNTVTGTSVTFPKQPAGDYVFLVHSLSDRYGESSEGSQASVTIGEVEMLPPGNVTYTIKNLNDIVLSWEAAPNATAYNIYQIIDGQPVLKGSIKGTTTTYTNIPAGNYEYIVFSYSDRFGESASGTAVSVTVEQVIMEAPSGLSYTVKNGNDIVLSWNAAANATGYKVYQIVNGQKVLKSTVSNTTITFGNQPAGDYQFVVHSYSTRFGESSQGSNITFPLVHPVLQSPANATYTVKSATSFALNWDAAVYATGYKVYQIVNGQKVLKSTTSGTTFTFNNMTPGTYKYEIYTYSSRFGESSVGTLLEVTLEGEAMLAPTNVTYTIASGNNITLRWNKAEYATSYKIYLMEDGQPVLQKTVTSTSVTFVNMAEGNYEYRIHSYSDRLGESAEGGIAVFTLVFPTMQAPENLTYTIANGNDIQLRWNAAEFSTSYKVYKVIGGNKELVKTITGTSVSLTNMPEGDYSYEVHSYSDRFGESAEGSRTGFTLVHPTMQAPAKPTYSISNGNDIVLRWTASEFAKSYNIYQVSNGQKTLARTVTSTSVTFTNMPEGDYIYEIHSFSDRFGESQAASSVSLNLTWPTVQPPVMEGKVFNVNNITLSWKKVEWANEYRVYDVSNGDRKQIYKGSALTYNVYNLTEKTHAFVVTAYSTRFGESVVSNEIRETIVYPEMQPPTASLTLLDGKSARISWNFITYANGYNVYEIIDGKPVPIAEKVNNLSYLLSDLSYANHEYYVTSYSNSFGESEPSNVVWAKLIVDTESPVTTASAPIGWTNQDGVVTLSATDDETGVAGTFYAINDGEFTQGTSVTVTEEGVHRISFYSVDYAGNTEAVQAVQVKIDRTAPVTTANEVPGWYSQPVTVELSSTDGLSGVAKTFYSVNGSAYSEGTSLTVEQEGVHQVSYYSVDHAGNAELAKSVEVKIDKSAPIVTVDMNEELALGSTFSVNYSATDDESGIAAEAVMVFAPGNPSGTIIEKGSTLSLDKPGVYQVIVEATNAAGLSTKVTKRFVVYIPISIEVTPKVIKGNKGVFTVRIDLPETYAKYSIDLQSATLNGVSALTSNSGYYNQAKQGQFKFERSDFVWTTPEVLLEFEGSADGYIFVGQTTVKVQK